MIRIGVLALQGDFEAHCRAIESAGAQANEVRRAAELGEADGLIIPGGESTTMLKLIDIEGLWEPLRRFGASRPIFGTCAGAILLAREVTGPNQPSLALMDISVERNAYGRQVHSRVATVASEFGPLEAVFIRAPVIRRAGPGVKVLARYGEDPVLVEEGKHLAATFHPELSRNGAVHEFFLNLVRKCAGGH